MAGVTIDNSGLLFTRYLEGVTETLNQASTLRRLAGIGEDSWQGSHIEFTLHVNRNPSIRYGEDGSAFPVPKKQGYTRAKAYRKFVYGSIQLTDGIMATAGKSKQVARDAISSEVQGMMQGIMKYENFFMSRDGTGAVATVKATSSASGYDFDVDDSRGLWETGVYAWYDSTLATRRGFVTVNKLRSALNSGYMPVDISEAALPGSATTGDKLVWAGSDSTTDSLNRAITGLDKLIDDAASTFQNVNVSTYPKYASLVLDNSGTNRDLTPALFRQMLAGLMQKTGNEKPAGGLKVLTNAWQAINVEELYEGELRLTPESKTAGLAVAAFQSALGRVEILTETDALYNKMFFADFSKIKRAVQKPLSWRREGGQIFKRSDTSAVWTATAEEICDLYIKERHTSGKIEDLSETKSSAY